MQILAFPAKRKKPILKVESNRARIFFFSQIGSISLKTRKASFDEKKKEKKEGEEGGKEFLRNEIRTSITISGSEN